jgi:hypothetical protein
MAWGMLLCCLLLYVCRQLPLATPAHQDLFFLYYQPWAPMLAMLWMWGIAVGYWEQRHVRYDACFSPEDQRRLPPSAGIFEVRCMRGWVGVRISVREERTWHLITVTVMIITVTVIIIIIYLGRGSTARARGGPGAPRERQATCLPEAPCRRARLPAACRCALR